MPGHDKAAGLGETPRRHEKNATSEGKADDPGNRFPGRGRLGRREQPAHEPLILRATLVEVPLTGLFFGPLRKIPKVGDTGLEPVTPSLSSTSAVVLSPFIEGLTTSDSGGCTQSPERLAELARAGGLVAPLPISDADRRAVLERLCGG